MPDISLSNTPSTAVDQSQISTSPNMSQARTNFVVSEFAAYGGDMAVYNAAMASQRGAYINGVFVPGISPYIATGVTNGAGQVVFYLTTDGTANGAALFSNIPPGGVLPVPVGANNNYQVTATTVSADMKTVTVGVNQLGTVAAGLITVVAAAANVSVVVTIWVKV